jgi:plasmid replication initiation protein
MDTKTTNKNNTSITEAKSPPPLMAKQLFQHELFICDVSDAVPNDLVIHMGHPFYSLSKKPEMNVRRYEHNGNWIEVTPSVKGLATIYDKDILIYCISQIMAKLKKNEPVSPRVRINSRELLIFTNRGTSGRDYKALIQGLDRLEGTRIRTNIRSGDKEQSDSFGLIDSSSIHRKKGLDGRLLWCEVKLSEWVFNAIRAQEVLTLHNDYFKLRKPIERRVYEIARKHCGQQDEWKIGLEALYKKTGCQSPLKRFRQMFRILVSYNHLPEYSLIFDGETDMVSFSNREKDTCNVKICINEGFLNPKI